MAVTTAIIAGTAVSTGYGIYAANKAAKTAQKAQQSVLASRPSDSADRTAADKATLDAQTLQRKRSTGASGRQSTILTGPGGLTAAPPPPATKTLLGL